MTRRYEEVRHAVVLAGQTRRSLPAIPLSSALSASVTCWLFRPLGNHLSFLAMLQFVDTTDLYKQRWIEKQDRRSREIQMAIKITEIERNHLPELEIVRIARPTEQAAISVGRCQL